MKNKYRDEMKDKRTPRVDAAVSYYDSEAGHEVTHRTEDGIRCCICRIDIIAPGAPPFYLGYDAKPCNITMLNNDPNATWKTLRRPSCHPPKRGK